MDGGQTKQRVSPHAIFSDPKLGRVGMTEAEGREASHAVRVGRFDFKGYGKANEMGESEGTIQVHLMFEDACMSQYQIVVGSLLEDSFEHKLANARFKLEPSGRVLMP
ncbi:hypothetical protein [Noviherbaspirillum sp.]|uniref:hypothetical protein n=1 Tax=Noviherbaspirillum sp. TaxID=1926288 RepID=UPI002B474685|nr:hypothetical protein [Noviherbaspirillum sp.]HJV79886.1 hypothetical protein [Noviherbaspirillum sp.]